MKSKKSALLLSFTSLLLCFAMLVGSTFAWFTDTATTGVNKIQSGTLDVGLNTIQRIIPVVHQLHGVFVLFQHDLQRAGDGHFILHDQNSHGPSL